MREVIELSIHLICRLAALLKPDGVKVVMAQFIRKNIGSAVHCGQANPRILVIDEIKIH